MPILRHTYSFPTHIEYGPGAIFDLPKFIAQAGYKKGLLVTDTGIEKAGIADSLRDVCEKSGISIETFSDVQSNPTDDNVYQGTKIYKDSNCEFIIGLGGGSPMDAGKTIKCLATHDGPLEKYDDSKGGDRLIKNNMPPFYAIPTTAGTGSEVGRSSVITIKKTNTKTIIFSPFLMPTIAVLDPEITRSLPPHLTAATGVDALVHNLEAFIMPVFHPFADALAKDAIERIFNNLPLVVQNGGNIAARGEMLLASAMGATAFQKGLGVNHSIAHALGVIYDMHHGLANAAVLNAVMKYNIEDNGVRQKMASLGRIFNTDTDAEKVIESIKKWQISLGLPVDLKGLGIKQADVSAIEEYALKDPCCPLNPRKVEKGDVAGILQNLI
ncbi:MAG: iron-containing alcohol dehydrogenase [Calditrichaeota bacterium]|nr:MAG: iron-containing alcohol dehydrogenase [Calditrichota bacterium]